MKNKKKKIDRRITSKSRRAFVQSLPALGAVSFVATKLPLTTVAQTPSPTPLPSPSPSPTPTPRITKEMLHTAERLIGIEFTDAQGRDFLPPQRIGADAEGRLDSIWLALSRQMSKVQLPRFVVRDASDKNFEIWGDVLKPGRWVVRARRGQHAVAGLSVGLILSGNSLAMPCGACT